jgi:hypothetical protein
MSGLTWEKADAYAKQARDAGDTLDQERWERLAVSLKSSTWTLSADGKSVTNEATGVTKPWP